jgi:glycosyltransferase involved in cell wall biosynthesis
MSRSGNLGAMKSSRRQTPSHRSSSQPYRIGIDARFYRKSTGGLGRYTRELLKGLAALDDHNQYYVFLTEADLNEWELDQPNFIPIVTDIQHYSVAEQTKFLKFLNQQKLDLVHFLNFNHPVLYRKPFVTTLHDLTMLHFPIATKNGKKSALKFQLFKRVFVRSLAAAKRVIAISEYSAADAEKTLGVSHAKMEVVYEGHPTPEKLEFGSKKVVQDFIGSRQPYFLFVSQWRAHKGILTLLDGFAEFKRKTGLPHILVIAGKPDAAAADVKAALAAHPFASEICTPGFVPDELLPALYSYTAGFIMPSEYEGFGLPVLEALTYGTPTIVANNSSLPEVGGKAVLYFPTNDGIALAENMAILAKNPTMVEQLRAAIPAQLAKFSWEKCADETLEVYASILEKRR